ncbi:MAG: hypothetical protein CMM54_01115 [Rhodospirillaceae bacterium]|nr:hypothetical protein [Rhodospirillaceae bacterium]
MAKDVFAEAIQHHEAGSVNKEGKLYTNPKKPQAIPTPSSIWKINIMIAEISLIQSGCFERPSSPTQKIWGRVQYRWKRYRNQTGASFGHLESFCNSLEY